MTPRTNVARQPGDLTLRYKPIAIRAIVAATLHRKPAS